MPYNEEPDSGGAKMKIFTVLMCCSLILSLSCSAEGAMMGHDMGEMNKNLEKLSGKDFDVAFYSMMIPHHQGAIKMSQKILETTQDSQIEKWARAIIESQTGEIDTMRADLDMLGGIDGHYYSAMESDMADMVEKTKDDRDFVLLMIEHHKSAVEMAGSAKERTKRPELLAMAQAILTQQQQEIEAFRVWLEAKKG